MSFGFFLRWYGETQTNFLANPRKTIHYWLTTFSLENMNEEKEIHYCQGVVDLEVKMSNSKRTQSKDMTSQRCVPESPRGQVQTETQRVETGKEANLLVDF